MYSTIHKFSSKRKARAQAVLTAPADCIRMLRERTVPKGDALETARAAALLACKKTWEVIPHCHPIPIDHISIKYEFMNTSVTIFCEVDTIGKTGVEMEALMGAQTAAITIYDMLKPISTEMSIDKLKVVEKRGGKNDFQERIPDNFKAAVIVSSDGTFEGIRADKSGQIIKDCIESYTHTNCDYVILPDEQTQITDAIKTFVDKNYHLVMTTGGTGLGPRDVTVEATANIIEREIPGIMEAARTYGQERTPYAMLSRGLAGTVKNTLIINLPGSSAGTKESLEAIFPAVLHSFPMMKGGKH